MAGLFARATAREVGEACAAHVGGEVVAFVLAKTVTERLLYVVTEREVAVLRLGRGPGDRLNPKALLGSWPRGQVEVEDGIASLRFGPHRGKVRFADRKRAAEVARLAGLSAP